MRSCGRANVWYLDGTQRQGKMMELATPTHGFPLENDWKSMEIRENHL
jgi:hypothetical protein